MTDYIVLFLDKGEWSSSPFCYKAASRRAAINRFHKEEPYASKFQHRVVTREQWSKELRIREIQSLNFEKYYPAHVG